MSVKIAHASIDENNRAKGGQAGDQTGREVCIRDWYNKPWGCVIRFTDATMAEKVAKCMEMAAANDNIGYNQNKRNTLLTEARKVNFNLSKIKVKCETDCSGLVSVACMYAGIPESVLVLNGNCAHTRNLRGILKSTGEVEIYTTPLYTSHTEKLKRGDILLKEGSHVAVVVKTDTPELMSTSNPYILSASLLKRGSKGESVKWLQYELNKHGYKLNVDADFGVKTEAAVKEFQKKNNLTVDGIVGKNTIAKLKELAG